jgi:hypothetical protein
MKGAHLANQDDLYATMGSANKKARGVLLAGVLLFEAVRPQLPSKTPRQNSRPLVSNTVPTLFTLESFKKKECTQRKTDKFPPSLGGLFYKPLPSPPEK